MATIIVGITGGIAAYKTLSVLRELTQAGHQVHTVLTDGAKQFVTELSITALTGIPPRSNLFDLEAESAMGHIELARAADLLLIAPLTANTMAKIAQGQADCLLTTLILATNAKKLAAPAMNVKMWEHPATARNLAQLKEDGFSIIGPDTGAQACGDVGMGRMSEPDVIVAAVKESLLDGPLSGINITITAGPTIEPIDPIRYISNRSSGKMGYAIAKAAAALGANVHLVSGPVNLAPPVSTKITLVETANQMLAACQSPTDIFIGVAAVADWRPECAQQKVKCKDDWKLELKANPDIISQMHHWAKFVVGFAAETEGLLENGQKKLDSKNLDLIAINKADGANSGFNSDTNSLIVLGSEYEQSLPLANKTQIAYSLLEIIAERYRGKIQSQNSGQENWQRHPNAALCD